MKDSASGKPDGWSCVLEYRRFEHKTARDFLTLADMIGVEEVKKLFPQAP
jgi:hypothetical protein